MIKAVVFDLDGTLVDSVPWHEEAFNRALQDVCGFRLGEYENKETFTGKLTKDKLRILQDQSRVEAGQFDDIVRRKKEHLQKGIADMAHVDVKKQEIQEKLREIGIRTACVTNSNEIAALSILEAVGLLSYFEFVIVGEDVAHHKPCGEGYVNAMVSLGSKPRETAIIEDSFIGIQAAQNTGAHTWAIDHPSELTWSNLKRFLEEIRNENSHTNGGRGIPL